MTPFLIDLSAQAFQDVNSQVTFRIYGYAPAGSGLGLFFDNITLTGQVVPEPAGAWTLGAVSLVLRRRRCGTDTR